MLKKIIALSLPILVTLLLSLVTLRQVSSLKVAGVSTSNEPQKINALIMPHHDLAKEYITASLEKIAQNQDVSTIAIIGPNHFQEEGSRFISTDELLDYPISKDFVYKLENTGLVALSKATIENEHSITVPLLYLQNYFPNAEFIPIIAPRYFDISEISQIALFLKAGLPEDTLYVASVDFAHNKMLLEAMENNYETEVAIKSFDYEKIYQFDDSHTDSPASLGLLLNIMQKLGTTNWETWYNSHGALIENKPDLQGTSYLIGTFTN